MAGLKRMIFGSFEIYRLIPGTTRIGRASECDIQMTSPVVSKRHAVIDSDGQVYTLKNESKKGTSVNGQTIMDSHPLKDGDEILIGLERFVFLATVPVGESPESAQTAMNGSSEDSIRHVVARVGVSTLETFPDPLTPVNPDKIQGRISLNFQTLSSLAVTNSVRKLSEVLRFTEIMAKCGSDNFLDCVVDALYQFFPQTTQAVIAEEISVRRREFRISATHCRNGDDSALICKDVIHHVAKNNECLLLADQWRDTPGEKPKLSRMGRISILCVPMRRSSSGDYAVVQLIAQSSGSEFQMGDLERLAILAQLFTMALPFRSGS